MVSHQQRSQQPPQLTHERDQLFNTILINHTAFFRDAEVWRTIATESLPLTAGIPIIICTTNPRLAEAQAAHLLTDGCDILEKPFELEELLTRVRARIELPDRPETLDTPS